MDRVDHFGRDLFVVLDREDRRPLRVQLEEQLRDGVRDGRLHAGTALPSTRALAAELGVARGVVVEAYGQLVAEGFLVARRGSATRVAKVAPAVGGARGRARRPHPARSASTCARSRPSAARSRAARGWPRCAARWPPRPTPTSATARGPARRGCAPSSPPTSAARAAWSPTPTTSSSPPGSPRRSRCSPGCCAPAGRAACSSRSRASGSTARSCSAPGSSSSPSTSTTTGCAPMRCRAAAAALVTPAHQFPTGACPRARAPRGAARRGPTPTTPS